MTAEICRFARAVRHGGLGRFLLIAVAAALLQHLTPPSDADAAEPEILPVLARVGPWPVASQPILYRGRLWFANSVKGVNHNSADIYSLGAASADPRYERHLWSQDAGTPVVADGLLYWPSEDPRITGAWGEFQATDGENWETGLISSEIIFHVHSMVAARGQIYAATSAWQGALHVSSDKGRSWRRIFLHPKSDKGISRIVSLAIRHDQLFGLLRDREGFRLIVSAPGGVQPIAEWPVSRLPTQLATLGGWTYGLVDLDGVRELWRSNGAGAERVHRFDESVRPFALTSDDGALWLLSGGKNESAVLKSPHGRAWSTVARLSGGKAYDLLAAEKALVVAGAGADGRGILWGRFENALPAGAAANVPRLIHAQPPQSIDWKDAAAGLDVLLADE